MNRLVPAGVLFAFITGLAGPVIGQSSSSPNPPNEKPCSLAFGDTLSLYTPGKPFVATYVARWSDTTSQKSDDGADAAPEMAFIKLARSSSGKVYKESWLKGAPGHSFWVADPVSGISFFWNEPDGTRIVLVHHGDRIHSRKTQELLRRRPWEKRAWALPLCATYLADLSFNEDESPMQDLGTSRILNIDAQGVQATRNDGLLTEERWFSPYLELMLTSRTVQSQFGTSVVEIKSLEQVEPDPNLFRLPAGYEVRDFPEMQSAH